MTTKCQHDSSPSLPLITFSPLRKVTKLSRIFIFNTLILPVKQQPVNKINPYPVLTLYHIPTCTIIVHFLSFTLLIMLIKTSSTPIIIDRRAQIPPKPTRHGHITKGQIVLFRKGHDMQTLWTFHVNHIRLAVKFLNAIPCNHRHNVVMK